MKCIYHIIIVLLIYLTTSNSVLHKNKKDNVLVHLKDPNVVGKKILRTRFDPSEINKNILRTGLGVDAANNKHQIRYPNAKEINKKILRSGIDPDTEDYKYDEPVKTQRKKVFYYKKKPSANKINPQNSQSGLEVDAEEYKGKALAYPSREVQRDDEETREFKITTKKTRFKPKSNFFERKQEYEEVKEQNRPTFKFIHEKEETPQTEEEELLKYNRQQHLEDVKDAKNAKHKARIFKTAKKHEEKLNNFNLPKSFKSQIMKERYHMDPVLNVLRTGNLKRRRGSSSTDISSSSSSREMMDWKDEFREHWEHKRWEALNMSNQPFGDEVNMVAARPWGVPCGDPNQHDMPWGTCMLAIECESEYRIYRGDYFCGRTQFVCCALQMTNYDLYQGIDVSFDDKSLSTDSDEKNPSKENKKRKGRKRRQKRRRERKKRKRRIKRNIKKTVKQIKKIIDKHYKNGTKMRKRKTKQLKKFVKQMKKKYKKEREAIKDLHEEELIKIDITVMRRLQQIRNLNENFMKNSTFRDIIVNGTATKQGARMLVEAYPELQPYFNLRRSGTNGELKTKDYLEYDIEYGYLYY